MYVCSGSAIRVEEVVSLRARTAGRGGKSRDIVRSSDRKGGNSISGLHFERIYALRGHSWSAHTCPRGDGLFVPDKGLRVELEGFSHELGDPITGISILLKLQH